MKKPRQQQQQQQEGGGMLRSSSSSSSCSNRVSCAENVVDVPSSAVVVTAEHSEEQLTTAATMTWKHRVVNIGCMSGVFHLFSSKYYIRRKFITAEDNQRSTNNKQTTTGSGSTTTTTPRIGKAQEKKKQKLGNSSRELTPERESVPGQHLPQPPSSPQSSSRNCNSPVVIRIQHQIQPTVVKDKNSHQHGVGGGTNYTKHTRSSSEPAQQTTNGKRLSSCEVQRSPTIPAEIRRSTSSLDSIPPTTTTPGAVPLLARLMGLEDHHSPSTTTTTPVSTNTTPPSTEKRRKLLGALDKCDEDLESLKRMIETIRSTKQTKVSCVTTTKLSPAPQTKVMTMSNSEQPSPVSVLDDEFDWSPTDEGGTTDHCNFATAKRSSSEGHNIGQQWIRINKLPTDNNVLTTSCRRESPPSTKKLMILLHRHITYNRPVILTSSPPLMVLKQQQQHRGFWTAPRSLNNSEINTNTKTDTTATLPMAAAVVTAEMIMAETVEDVCREVEWGKKWEVRRIGMFVEDSVYEDLVEEIVKEMMMMMGRRFYLYYSVLPYERCKRKLRF